MTAAAVSYLWFDGGLDAARIAVRERRSGVLVTGFVQTEGLVQNVNAVHLEPYDRRALVTLVTSTTALLAALARTAPTGPTE